MPFSGSFKITRDPRTFQAGESTGFNLSLGRQYYDRKTKQKEWSNYKCVVFGQGNQLAFYQQALVVGTIIELTADELKIDNYNPEYLSIELIDARVTGIHTNGAPQQRQQRQQQPARQAQQATQQQAPQQQQPQGKEGFDAFDSDIPF